MPTKKKQPSKKSIEYVRPQPGTFTLEKFPGVEFKFRLITIDDESWCIEKLGKTPWGMIKPGAEAMAADLCRMYFHFLTDGSKRKFVPEEREEMDYETGKTNKVIVSGPRLFMQSVDGGSITEITIIGHAFLQTLLASRPLDAMPEEMKKKVQEWIRKEQSKKTPEPPVELTLPK